LDLRFEEVTSSAASAQQPQLTSDQPAQLRLLRKRGARRRFDADDVFSVIAVAGAGRGGSAVRGGPDA
jgi:hypothetical protein